MTLAVESGDAASSIPAAGLATLKSAAAGAVSSCVAAVVAADVQVQVQAHAVTSIDAVVVDPLVAYEGYEQLDYALDDASAALQLQSMSDLVSSWMESYAALELSSR